MTHRYRHGWLLFMFLVLQPRRGLPVIGLLLLLLILASVALGSTLPASLANLNPGDCPQPGWLELCPGHTTRAQALAAIESNGWARPGTLQDSTPSTFQVTSSVEFQTAESPVYDVRMRFVDENLTHLALLPRERVTLAAVFSVFGAPSHGEVCLGHVVPANLAGFLSASAPAAPALPSGPQPSSSGTYNSLLSATLFFFDGAVEVQAVRLQPLPLASFATSVFTPARSHAADWLISPDMLVARIVYHADLLNVTGLGPLSPDWQGFVTGGPPWPCP